MVIGNRVDYVEFFKVEFEGGIVALPSGNIKRRMVFVAFEVLPLKLVKNGPVFFGIFEMTSWILKVLFEGKSISSDDS